MDCTFPLISCICITRRKPAMLKRVIECFNAQTYPNRELVVIYEHDDTATADFVVHSLSDAKDIRVFELPRHAGSTLGMLRNEGVKLAKGEFIAQWDDDDWYHSDRLYRQYQSLVERGKDGAILTQWMVLDMLTGNAYISNKRLWEGSILCRRSRLLSKAYENLRSGEDTSVIDHLISLDCLYPLDDASSLYVYIYHGNNTWDYAHWTFIFQCSTALSREESLLVSAITAGQYPIAQGSAMLDAIVERQYRHAGILQ